jgi:HSP20 family molecular chaperone IbpA
MPGVDKENLKLNVVPGSIEIKTEGKKVYYKMINFESAVDPDSAKLTHKNGILTIELEKMKRGNDREIKIK